MLSGSSSIRASVSRTASRSVSGSALRSSFARRVSRSSGKPELAPHLVQREEATSLDVFPALAERLERLVVVQDLKGLLERLPLLGRDDDGGRAPIAGDDDVLVP